MALSSRRNALTFGVLLTGFFGIVEQVFGQQAKTDQLPQSAPSRIGTLNLQAIYEGYQKVKSLKEQFAREVKTRSLELAKFQQRGKEETVRLETLTPGTPEHQKTKATIDRLQFEFDAAQKQAQEEFAARETLMLSQLQKEVRAAASVVARKKGFSVVLQLPKEPAPTDSAGVMASTC